MRSSTSVAIVAVLVLSVHTAPAEDQKVFFGALHSHTSYSDGSGLPYQAYRHARDVAKVDFFAVTEHNHSQAEAGAAADRRDGILIAKDHTLYNGSDAASVISTANTLNKDNEFVAIYGQEFSSISKGNHMCVLDAPEVIDEKVVPNGAFDKLFDWVTSHPDSSGQPCILQFNHPDLGTHPKIDYGRDDFGTDVHWIEAMGKVTHLIEIMNGPAMAKTPGNAPAELMERHFLKYLALGFRLGPTADQDNHYFTWGDDTNARTAVVADGLTRQKILSALRARHVYATQDNNLRIIARINKHLCGDVVDAPAAGTALAIEVSIKDDDEPSAGYDIDVFSGEVGGPTAKVVSTYTVNTSEGDDDTPWSVEDVKYTGGRQYVFLRVTQVDEDGNNDIAWLAPVWFDTAGALGVAAVAPVSAESALVASKRSNVYHVSMECADAKRISPKNLVHGAEAAEGRALHQGCPKK